MPPGESAAEPRIIGRYAIFDEIASGGMASVHIGRLMGPVGFARTVAIKRLHPQFAKDPEFVAMFLDEARLAARIQHPNVVATLDVVALDTELFLIMEYVRGESLSRLLRSAAQRGERIPAPVAVAIAIQVLAGLHAAHEARSDRGTPLGIVHRDVSPQNVLIGSEGVSRVVDFGIAKAAGRMQSTGEGQLKGKLSYMSPEQVRSAGVDRRTDIYAMAVVIWEMLAGKKLFRGDEAGIVYEILEGKVPSLTTLAPDLPDGLEAIVKRGLSLEPEQRFETALEMADALEHTVRPATARDVARWVEKCAGPTLVAREQKVVEIESSSVPGAVIANLKPKLATIGSPSPGGDDLKTLTSAATSTSGFVHNKPGRRIPTWVWTAMGGALIASAIAVALLRRESTPAKKPDPLPSVASAPVVSALPSEPAPATSASVVPSAAPPPEPAKKSRAQPASAPPQPRKRKKMEDLGF